MSFRLAFTKMHGAGNDFVVVDATRAPVSLTRAQWRWVADRHFGVGADQILVVQPPDAPDVDFVYRIFNADGGEVEQCGNGARCFVRFVRDRGLTTKDAIRVRTLGGVIEPRVAADGRIEVDMGRPVFEAARVPFVPDGLASRTQGDATLWALPLDEARLPVHDAARTRRTTVDDPAAYDPEGRPPGLLERVARHLQSASGAEAGGTAAARTDPARTDPGRLRWIEVVSMGNPHAVQIVDDVEAAPVGIDGPVIESHVRFPQRVNAGFMQIASRSEVHLRVFERGSGETLACGSGACAAVASGVHRGLLERNVHVHTRGGRLTIRWEGAQVLMTGPAETVFSSEVLVPDEPFAGTR
ncbi:MAG: diaminopimelate epimerase [Lautropia sp.]